MNRNWTPEDENFLQKYYPENGSAYCAKELGKTQSSVKSKARKLNIFRADGYRMTAEQKAFMIANVKELGVTETCRRIGVRKPQVYNILFSTGIKLCDWEYYTPEEVKIISDNISTLSYIQIGQLIGRSGDSVKNKAQDMGFRRTAAEGKLIQNNCSSGTQFKSGNLPPNTKTDFEITLRSPHRGLSYNYIRISRANWEPLQIYNWKKVNGPIPSDKILRSISGDTLDCRAENWKIIDRAEHLAENNGRDTLEDKYISMILSRRNKTLRESIAQLPELLELKRNQLKLRRTINELNQTSETNR